MRGVESGTWKYRYERFVRRRRSVLEREGEKGSALLSQARLLLPSNSQHWPGWGFQTRTFFPGGGEFLTRIADTHTFSGRGFRRVALAVASQAYPATLLLVRMTQARSDRSD